MATKAAPHVDPPRLPRNRFEEANSLRQRAIAAGGDVSADVTATLVSRAVAAGKHDDALELLRHLRGRGQWLRHGQAWPLVTSLLQSSNCGVVVDILNITMPLQNEDGTVLPQVPLRLQL